jgi:uncharacterized protein involved in exopolysaccharide biosynthesis
MLRSLADVAPSPSGPSIALWIAVTGLGCLVVVAAVVLTVILIVRRSGNKRPPVS